MAGAKPRKDDELGPDSAGQSGAIQQIPDEVKWMVDL